MKKIITAVFAAVLLIAAVIYFRSTGEVDTQLPVEPQVSNFEECVAAGNPVMESYPRQCAAGGQTYVEEIGNELEKTDIIFVNNPRPNQLITSPLEVTGEARGTWYFEADFPVYLYDANGNELAVAPATAQGEWMTEDFVAYSTTLEFAEPETDRGELVLEKSNPSGLPEQEDEIRIPVRFR